MDGIGQLIQQFVIQAIIAAAIFFLGRWLADIIADMVRRVMVRRNTELALVEFVRSLTYWAVVIFASVAALGQLGIQTASFVAVIGAAGLAVGLALQGSLANFASGVLLLIFKPFRVGDYIEAAGTSGTVQNVQIFTTELTTPDNKQVIIPNAAVTGGIIVNVSAKDTRRVDLVMGIGYADDIDKARDAMLDEIAKDSRILKDPEPAVAVVELADSSVNFVVRPWVNKADYWGVYFDLTEAIKKRFDADGISIPFPQQDVHLYKADQK